MAKLKDGFYKLTAEAIGSDTHVLLAGGGSKALSDFATSSGVSDSLKQYVTLNTALTITGLKTFESNSNTIGVSLILKNKGWKGGMSTAIDFYNGNLYTVPNARIETKTLDDGRNGGTLIFYTQEKHAETNPNPNNLTERFRIGDNGVSKITGLLTINGSLNLAGNNYHYKDKCGINMNNSDIIGVNSIVTLDLAESGNEGIKFYRDSTHVDSLWAQNGNLYFNQNMEVTSDGCINGTNRTVIHSGNIGSQSVNYATNADKLDGYDAGLTNNSVAIYVPFPSSTTLKSEGFINNNYGVGEYGHPDEEFLKGICKWAINKYPNKGDITLMGIIAPNSSGTCILHLYSSSGKDSTTKLPRYCRGQYLNLSGLLCHFGTIDYTWSYGKFASASDFKRVNVSNVSYTPNLTKYGGGSVNNTYYYKVSISNVNNIWTMLYLEMDIKENYINSNFGKLIIHLNKNAQNGFSGVYALILGTLSNSIKVYVANGTTLDIYIAGNWNYSTVDVSRLNFGDGSTSVSKSITLDTTTTLPSTYTTANIIRSVITDQRFNYGLAYYNTDTATVTGTIVITLPNGWNNSMNTYEIDLYEYNGREEAADNRQHSKIIISGYNYSGSSNWVNYGYQQIGSYNKGVRLGYNGSKCCILLGTTTTTWSYPQVHLSRVITGYSNQTAWSTGYSISVITSETGYSKIVSAGRTRQRFDDVVANNFRGNLIGTASNADKLDNIDSTGFLRQVVVSNNTENDFNTFSNMTLTGRVDPATGASLKNAPWSGSGPAGGYGVLTYLFNGSSYGTQMAWGYHSNRIYIRNKYWTGSGSAWTTTWDSLALTSDLKNPTDYYWANVKVSSSSDELTKPTFGKVTIYDGTDSILSLKTKTAGVYAYLAAYNTGGQYGADVVLHSGSAMVLGAGESAASMYSNNVDSLQGSENLYLTADDSVKVFTNCNTIADRKHVATFDTNGSFNAYGSININGGSDLNLRASSLNNDTGDLVFTNSNGTELGRIWLNGSNFSLRYGSSDPAKTIIHSENYSSYALPFYTKTSGDCDTMSQGLTALTAVASNQYGSNHSTFLTITSIGTPFQLQIPDSSINYVYKRYKSGSTWSAWSKLSAGYADSAGNADTVDSYHATSFAIWRGDASTDSTATDTSSTSTADFFAKINATSGLFNSRFGAMRGSWWYVGNTQLNTGVGTLEMAGTAVLNLGSKADTTDTYKSLLFLDQGGRLWSYTANETAVKQWSRYVKTTDKIANASWADGASTVTVNNSDANSTYKMVWHSGNTLYSTAGIYCNPSTDAMYATRYYANGSSGPHFTGTSTAGNWAYLRLNNSAQIWDIATRSDSGSGGLWLSRYAGGDNGIFVTASSTPKVGINTSSPSYALHVSGDIYATGWSRADSGFYVEGTGVHYTSQGSVGEINMSWNNEFVYSTSNGTLYFNYRGASRGTTVTNYIWNAGSSSSYAKHTLGALQAYGPVTITHNAYPGLTIHNNTTSGEASMYIKNNTAGWALGVNLWSQGAGVFAIGQYSGTGSSNWRFKIDNNGYCYTSSYLNLGAGNEKNASNPPYVWGVNGSDNFMRTYATSSLSAGYLKIHDIRGNNYAPNSTSWPLNNIRAWFNNTGTPNGDWWSGITVKGWTNDYNVWLLASTSTNHSYANFGLFFRTGNGSSWTNWKNVVTSESVNNIVVTSSLPATKVNNTIYILV